MTWLGFLPDSPSSVERLHLPEWLNFECTACGKCCTSGWTVRVTPVIASVIEKSEIASKKKQEGYLPLEVSQSTGHQILGFRENRRCVFIDAFHRCELHAEVGGFRKPLVCQVYPFDLSKTPDGYYATASFACPAILAGVGPSVAEQRPHLEMLLRTYRSSVPHRDQFADRILFSEGLSLSWQQYLELEGALLNGLHGERPGPYLVKAAALLSGACQAGTSWNPEVVMAQAKESSETKPLELLIELTASALAFLEHPEDLQAQQELGTRLRYAPPAQSGRFPVQLSALELGRTFDQITEEVMIRYLVSFIFGKRLLRGSLLNGLLFLAASIEVLAAYLSAFADSHPDPGPSFPNLEACFELVETEFVTHTDVFRPLIDEYERKLRLMTQPEFDL